MRSFVPLFVLIALASACATPNPHVELPAAPSRDGSYDVRAAYMKNFSADSKEHDHVFLHNGTRVYYPEDLRPAVDADSPTAKAIDEHLAARGAVESWSWAYTTSQAVAYVGTAGIIGGLGMLFLPIAVDSVDALAPIAPYEWYPALGGFAVGAGLCGVAFAGIFGLNTMLSEELAATGETADRAARTYQQSLSDRVGIGVDANGLLFDLNGNALGGLRGDSIPNVEGEGTPQDI